MSARATVCPFCLQRDFRYRGEADALSLGGFTCTACSHAHLTVSGAPEVLLPQKAASAASSFFRQHCLTIAR